MRRRHEVLERVRAGGIDVVLLDIQMPELSGLEALQLFPADGPLVIFCTAHTAHAVAAFDVGAIDYLLKPIEAAAAAQGAGARADRDARRRYSDELARFKSRGERRRQPLDRLALPTRQGIVLLDPLTVSHAELEGELVTVYTRGRAVPLALSLQELESRLRAIASRASTAARWSTWSTSSGSSRTRPAATQRAPAAATPSRCRARPPATSASASGCARRASSESGLPSPWPSPQAGEEQIRSVPSPACGRGLG